MIYEYRQPYPNELMHYGILGMKWGVRRFQNEDGSLTEEGRIRYSQQASKMGRNVAKTATGIALSPIGVGIPLAVSGVHGIMKADRAKRILNDDDIRRREKRDAELNGRLSLNSKDNDPSKSIAERIGEKIEGGDPYPNRPNLTTMTNQELKDYVQRMENIQKVQNYYKTVDEKQADKGWEWIKDKGAKLGILATVVGGVAAISKGFGETANGLDKVGKVLFPSSKDESKKKK